MKTTEFTHEINGEDKKFSVVLPSAENQKEANKIYNTAFSDAIKAKALVRAKLDDVLVEQGLWDDKKQQEFNDLQNAILDGEKTLAKGGIPLAKAKEIAMQMKKNRSSLRELISVKTSLDTHTAEGQADNARFNYLVSTCLVYSDTKETYFKGYQDYLNRSSESVAVLAAQHLASMIYGLDSDYEEKLPENKFLTKYKFIDNNLRLINKEGHLIDENGKLIDESGRYVNEKGEFVDKNGNLVTEKGDYVVEFQPFLDDEGKPVEEDTPTAVAEPETNQLSTTSEDQPVV